jgi:cytochrome c oxidase subunit 2
MKGTVNKTSVTKYMTMFSRCTIAAIATLVGSAATAEYGLNMTEGVTDISKQVYGLHMMVLGICIIASIVVYGVIVYSLVKHRKSKGAVAAQFHESTTVEILWTAVPLIVLVLMAIPATKTLIAMEDSRNSEMTVKITGYQWKWHYDYQGEGVDFFSTLSTPAAQIYNREEKGEHYLLEVDKPLVIPVDTKVRFVLTAADVIHSWWVPDLGWKKDAIPGMVNDSWTEIIDGPGIYRGQCAELCGRDHGFMPIVVRALSKEDYKAWLEEQKNSI